MLSLLIGLIVGFLVGKHRTEIVGQIKKITGDDE